VIEKSDTLHAVSFPGLEAFGAVFWTPGTCGPVKSDSASIVFCRTAGDTFHFSATYPPRRSATLRYRIDEPLELVSSNITAAVSTDSFATFVSFASPANGSGLEAVLRRVPRTFGYIKVIVRDSASGEPLSGAVCSGEKTLINTAVTNDSGVAVVKVDTGYNAVYVHKHTWWPDTLTNIPAAAGETTTVQFDLPKLEAVGIQILPDPAELNLNSTLQLSAAALYPDSSTGTLAGTLVWTIDDSLGLGLDSTGMLASGMTAGFASVSCSSALLGFTASAPVRVLPVIVLLPIEDAYTRGGAYANDNYGSDSSLVVKVSGDPGYTRYTFLKFDLSPLLGYTADSAVLRLYCGSAPSAAVQVSRVDDVSWREDSVTWNSQPPFGNPLDTFNTGSTAGWKAADVSGLLPLSDTLVSLGLKDPLNSDKWIAFHSRENANPPVLEVRIRDAGSGLEGTDGPEIPRTLALTFAPNPFNPAMVIRYQLPEACSVDIAVFNVSGRKLVSLVRGVKQPGYYRVGWNGTDDTGRALSSGVYILRLSAGNLRRHHRMVFSK
jgi:hypothetical protein